MALIGSARNCWTRSTILTNEGRAVSSQSARHPMSKTPNRPVQLALTTEILRQAPLFQVLDEREAQAA